MTWYLVPIGNFAILRRSTEPCDVAIGSMCDHVFREHVAAQRGDGGDDDAGGCGDPTAAATGGGANGIGEQVRQSGDSNRGVCYTHRRDEHTNGDRCELDSDRDVEEPCTRCKANRVQHLVLLWVPCGGYSPCLLLVHPLLDLCPKGLGSGFVGLLE